jgi:flavin-dependent dehydrogenase
VSYGRPVSFAIRRAEFDDYLLCRSGARLELGQPLRSLRKAEGEWTANEKFRAGLVVAAGGHFCPVARLLGRGEPLHGPLIASEEAEFELSLAQQAGCGVAARTPEIYFCDDLLGYGWCVRKGNYLNVGLGRAQRRDLPRHVAEFCEFLKRQGRIPPDAACRFQGHAYLLYEQSTRPLVDDGVLWIGDAAGLAYSESGEGIHPAIESARMAAEVILAAAGDYRREQLEAYRRRVEARFGRRATTPAQRSVSALRRRAGGWLLGRRWFVRHVVLDRWFLRK